MIRFPWLPAFIIWCSLVIIATLYPGNHLPAISALPIMKYLDLVVHFFLFLVFGFLLTAFLLKKTNASSILVILGITLISGIIFAALTEFLQWLLPVNRNASFQDIIADVIGVITGSLLGWILIKRKK